MSKKILCLTTQDIRNPQSGGERSVFGSLNALARQGAVVDCLFPAAVSFTVRLESGINVRAVASPRRSVIHSLLRSLWLGLPYKFAKYHSAQLRDQVLRQISAARPDLILVHGSHLGQLGLAVARAEGLPVVLRPHNLEYLLVRQYARQCPALLRPLARWQAERTRRTEMRLWSLCDRVLFLSDADLRGAGDELAGSGQTDDLRLECVYDGVSSPRQAAASEVISEQSFLISGRINVEQNRRSLAWFLRSVWFPFVETHPDKGLQLTVCGAERDTLLQALRLTKAELDSHRVHIVGIVRDFQQEVRRHRFFVSPTIMGSGYRVKLAEAGAAGSCILLTPIDIQSLDFLADGHNCRLFSDLNSFAGSWKKYCEDPLARDNCRSKLIDELHSRMNWQQHAAAILKG